MLPHNMVYKTFHKGKYYISFKRGFDDSKRDITITVDKQFENDSLRITLSDDEDPTFLCRIKLTRIDFEDLKKQQALLIDFDNFPSQVVRLLQQCAANNMFLIIHQITPLEYNFEIVEHNEFRRLVHLSLKTAPATDSDVKLHMATTIADLKKTLAVTKNSASSNEVIWTEKCAKLEGKIHELTYTVAKMEEDKLRHETEFQEALKAEKDRQAQERLQWQKNSDNNMKNILATNQENLNKKDTQIEELNYLCKQLRESITQLENQIGEKSNRLIVLEKEVQKTHIEVATLKAKNASLEKEAMEKEKQNSQLSARCLSLEKAAKDNTDILKELNETIQHLKKDKNNLERRLSLSESLANKNNEAAHSTTEQLMKANQIISKQNTDLLEMKDKLLCRTAIALEQEKVIDHNVREIQDLKSQIENTKQNMDKLQEELHNLKEKYECNEQALKDRDETIKNNNMVIQWLHKKMEEGCPTDHLQKHKNRIHSAVSSTPHFIPNLNNSSEASDESINFYASSKMSNIDESPQPNVEENRNKTGLDPKYLRPACEDNQTKKKEFSRPVSIASQNQKGKENKNIDLPKVSYKEKKTSRPTTFRATPVSAYFS
ncbi:uncharacterized protein Sas-6 [Epargyreus clarus]|uniref:uncharacterized protein Sas-6 n=1 Tax=Epargyreus clarus TaxID=520877 RepID=UPI003C2CD57B